MRRKRRTVLLTVLFASLLVEPLAAIPAFARKYGVTCSLCHNPAPRLNAFGEQFAANGFEFAVGEAARDTIDTGDPLLRLMRDIPLAIRLDAYLETLTAGEPAASTDLKTPWAIKLLSGGVIAPKISYYLYFFMSERGEVAGLEDAYVQFTDLGGSGISVLAGQFQVSDPLFKRELRLQYEDYQAYRVRVGGSRADLTYDRGLMALWSPWTDGDIAVQLVNGQGLDEAGETRQYDADDGKAVAVRLSQGVGAALRIGAFGYFASEDGDGFGNEIRMYGPDASLTVGEVELNGQWLRRTDSRPFFADDGPLDTEVDALFAELVWSPQGPTGRWFFTGLYNRIDADAPVFGIRQGEAGLLERYESVAVGLNYLLARNFRLTGEAQVDEAREGARLIAGFMAAF